MKKVPNRGVYYSPEWFSLKAARSIIELQKSPILTRAPLATGTKDFDTVFKETLDDLLKDSEIKKGLDDSKKTHDELSDDLKSQHARELKPELHASAREVMIQMGSPSVTKDFEGNFVCRIGDEIVFRISGSEPNALAMSRKLKERLLLLLVIFDFFVVVAAIVGVIIRCDINNMKIILNAWEAEKVAWLVDAEMLAKAIKTEDRVAKFMLIAGGMIPLKAVASGMLRDVLWNMSPTDRAVAIISIFVSLAIVAAAVPTAGTALSVKALEILAAGVILFVDGKTWWDFRKIGRASHIGIFAISKSGTRLLYKSCSDAHRWSPAQLDWEEVSSGTELKDGLALLSPKPGQLLLFCVGEDGKMRHKQLVGDDWVPADKYEILGDNFGSPPAAVKFNGRVWLFSVTQDGKLKYRIRTGNKWGRQWNSIAGEFAGRPTVGVLESQLYVFCRDPRGQIKYRCRDLGKWMPGLIDLGGNFESSLGLAVYNGNFHLFGVDKQGQMKYKKYDGTDWHPTGTRWQDVGGELVGRPTLFSRGNKKLHIFCRGKNGRMQHKCLKHGHWDPLLRDGWWELDGSFTGDPVSAPLCENMQDENKEWVSVIGVGNDSRLANRWSVDGKDWMPKSGWGDLGGELKDSVEALSWNRVVE